MIQQNKTFRSYSITKNLHTCIISVEMSCVTSSTSHSDNVFEKNMNHYEFPIIGNFDEDSWLKIFHRLDCATLATVATVCKTFQNLAEKAFKKKVFTNGEYAMEIEVGEIGWKPVICRFRNVLTSIEFYGGSSTGVLWFIDEFISKSSVKRLKLWINPKEFEKFQFRNSFNNLETLTLCQVDELDYQYQYGIKHPIVVLDSWCPGLKSLTLTICKIQNEDFFFQSLPSLVELRFTSPMYIDYNHFWRFLSENNQLKALYFEEPAIHPEENWLGMINELLGNLETLSYYVTNTLDDLPQFRNDFINLKSLTFIMGSCNNCNGIISADRLLEFTKKLPSIEVLSINNCLQNSISNDQLIQLIDQGPLTLKQLNICSYKVSRVLKFGYDLHRQIYGMETRNRADICCTFTFGNGYGIDANNATTFKITKDGIWENDKIIVLPPTKRFRSN